MKQIIAFLSFTFLISFGFAQNAPVDFEAGGNGASWTWTVFENGGNLPLEIIPNPVSGVGNTTATVAKFTAVDAGMDWAGCETIDIGSFTFDINNSLVKLWVYKDVVSQVKVKFEGAGAPVESFNVENTVTGQWEELTFDFSAVIGNTYTKLVIFPDFAPRDQDNICYFDEMTFNAGTAPVEPTTAAPDPTQDAADVISMFSNVYTDVAVDTWLTAWSVGQLSDIQIAGNDTKKYYDLNFAGVETTGANLIDASGMTHFSIDMWTPDANDFKIKLVDFGADGNFGGGDDTEHEIIYPAPATAQWISYDIPLTDFTGLTNTGHIAQMILSKPTLGTIFVDNIYFYDASTPTEPTTAAPDPTQDAADVISMFSNVYTDVAVDTWLTAWSVGQLSDIQIAGNDTKKYYDLNFAGVETTGANLIDASGMTHFSIDMWTPDANDFKIKLVDFGADGNFGGGDDTEHEIIYPAPATAQWISYDIPLTDFTGLTNTGHIAQMILSKPTLGTIFVDNIYFYDASTPTEPTTAAPDPTQDAADVISMFSNVYTDVVVDTWLTAWSVGQLSDIQIAGNDTKKYYDLNFAGVETTGANLIDASGMTHFSIDMWTPDANDFKIKLVDFGADGNFGGGDDTEHEIIYPAPATAQWISYDIPLTDFTGLTNTGHIAQMILSKPTLGTIFVDNIYFYDASTPTEPTTAAPDPTQDAADVISMFSNVYTDVAVDTWLTAWSDGQLSDIQIAGNDTKKYYDLNTAGIETTGANLIDASGMTHFSLDMWTPDANDFKIKLVDFGADGAYGGGDDTEHEIIYPAPATAQWISYDIPLTDFTGLTNTDHIAQLILSKPTLGTIFVDNIYFYSESNPASAYCDTEVTHLNIPGETASAVLLTITNVDATSMYVEIESADTDPVDFLLVNNGSGATISDAVEVSPGVFRRTLTWVTAPENVDLEILWSKVSFGGNWMLNTFTVPFAATCNTTGPSDDATLSDLQVDGNTISGFVANITDYDYEVPAGTTIVPTVIATTNHPNASHTVNDAAGIPGTTTVEVTAEDGTTQLIYSVNFVFPDPGPTVAAPIPTQDPIDVISIYSGTYTDIAGTNFNPGWGQTTVVSFVDIVGNETMKYENFNYQGTQLAGNQDMSAMEFMHVDVWTPDATVIKVTPISQSSTPSEFLVELTPLNQGSWNSYDIPVGDFTGVSMADIHQLKFDGQAGVTPSTVYIDNIYFWKNPTAAGSDATLNDLQVDGNTVSGFSPNTLNYDVELPNGTTVVPTVTATTTDPNASYVINAAAALPGTTSVVVTADDGTTELTYNVIFTVADPVPTVGAPVPTHDEVADNVLSIYSDAYSNLPNTNFNPNWGQSTQVTVDEQVGGNNSLLYENLNYQGTNLGSADGTVQDFTGHDYIHVDFWTPNATALNFVLISQGSGEIPYALNITNNQWVSVDIPLTHFSGQGLDLSDIYQFKVDGGNGSTTVYFDNWYFWTVSASTDASLQDLQVDGSTINGFDAGVLSYDYEVPNGTTIVPTVTATTTSPNASYVVNDAAGLPGTTEVVVTAEDGTTNLTYYVNFIFPDPAPAVAAPVPTHEDQYVVSIYSDTYSDIAGTNFNPGWGQTTQVSFVDIAGNETMYYENFNYQGTQLDGNQDLSLMEFMHVDIWTADATSIQVTPISASTGEFLVELTPLNQGSWNSYDIPVGDFTGVSMADIHQLKFDGQAGVNPSNIYLDNIYFWKNPPASGTDATLSDLQVDNETIDGFSPSTLNYTVELPNGTTIVPTVTATTTDPDATYTINDAAALPGTTSVVVTAEDGVTILTYNVHFTLEDAVPTDGAPNPVHDETLHNVFSIYSDSYTNLENTNFNPSWGQSTQVAIDEPIGGNNTLVYTNLNYQGTNLGSDEGTPQDVSGHDFIHLDFWTPNATGLNFFLISQGSGEVPYALPVSTEEWVSVNIPMSHFSDQGLDLSDIYQFKVDGGDGSTTVYFDNWYFWNVIEGGDASLSDLQVDGETVDGFNSNVFSYDVELPDGTTIVPTVTATTTDANATYEIIDAEELPGTTEVIVTAADEVTTLTYYVNFLLPDEVPAEAAPTPTQLEENVISMFSDTYSDVEVDTWLTDWSVAVLEDVEIQGNPTKKYYDLDYAGIETVNSPIDLESAGMAYLHIDIWTANSTAFRIKLVDFGGDGFGGGNDTEAELEFTPVLSEWNSLDIPLEDFEGMNMSDLNQFIISSNPSGQSIVFIDNVFYWKDPVGIDENSVNEINIYPNPTRDFWYVNSEEVIHEIQVFDLSGRLVIFNQPEQSGIIQLDASDLNRGFYLIRINGSKTQEFKLIRD